MLDATPTGLVLLIASVAAVVFIILPLAGIVVHRITRGTPLRRSAVLTPLTRSSDRDAPRDGHPATGASAPFHGEVPPPPAAVPSGRRANQGGAGGVADAEAPAKETARSRSGAGQTRRIPAVSEHRPGGPGDVSSPERRQATRGDQPGGRLQVGELDAPSPERGPATPDGRRLRPVEPPAAVEPLVEDGRVRPVTVGKPARDGRSPSRLASAGISSVAIDAAQVEEVAVRAASVRGVGHRTGGIERQDSYRLRRSADGAWVIVAVADGVSSAPCSAAGAAAAVRLGSALLAEELEHNPADEPDGVLLMGRVAAAMCEAAPDRVDAHGVAALACTLTLAAIPVEASPTRQMWLARVGDSAAAVLDDGGWHLPFGEGGNSADGGVYALPTHSAHTQTTRVAVGDGAALVVFTDGIGEPLGDGTGEVGAWLARRWAAPPSGLGFAVDVAFDRATFTDDRTVVGVWPGQTGEPGEDL